MPDWLRRRVCLLAAAVSCCLTMASQPGAAGLQVVGDGIPVALAGPGDAARGRDIAMGREAGCTLCHQLPPAVTGGDLPLGGDIGPPLAGTGSRWAVAQLRLRIVDPTRLNADSVMPAYHRTDGLRRVGSQVAGRPILDAQQVEDVVAWLSSLK
jgi:L-cysteine S-thiosulfotransferase